MSGKPTGRKMKWSVTIYCSRQENEQIRTMAGTSTSRSLSEYARKVLTAKPVAVTYRNVSLDDLIGELNALRRQLDEIIRRGPGPAEMELMRMILQEIKFIANKITEPCILK